MLGNKKNGYKQEIWFSQKYSKRIQMIERGVRLVHAAKTFLLYSAVISLTKIRSYVGKLYIAKLCCSV